MVLLWPLCLCSITTMNTCSTIAISVTAEILTEVLTVDVSVVIVVSIVTVVFLSKNNELTNDAALTKVRLGSNKF